MKKKIEEVAKMSRRLLKIQEGLDTAKVLSFALYHLTSTHTYVCDRINSTKLPHRLPFTRQNMPTWVI
jgi:hypothetical protein